MYCFYKTNISLVWRVGESLPTRDWSEFSSVTLWHLMRTNTTFLFLNKHLFLNKLHFPSLNNLFKMPHLSQMDIKWRKYVFFLLLDQIAFSGPNTEWIYSCNLCETRNTHRPSMYVHLETCHSSPRILDYILNLEFQASKQEIVQYFCDDHSTNISMQ